MNLEGFSPDFRNLRHLVLDFGGFGAAGGRCPDLPAAERCGLRPVGALKRKSARDAACAHGNAGMAWHGSNLEHTYSTIYYIMYYNIIILYIYMYNVYTQYYCYIVSLRFFPIIFVFTIYYYYYYYNYYHYNWPFWRWNHVQSIFWLIHFERCPNVADWDVPCRGVHWPVWRAAGADPTNFTNPESQRFPGYLYRVIWIQSEHTIYNNMYLYVYIYLHIVLRI